MKSILYKSGWLSATALAFLFICLWTLMALSTPSGKDTQAESSQRQAAYSLALPTIMAPVIRKEVRKEAHGEVAYGRNCLKLPAVPRTLIFLP